MLSLELTPCDPKTHVLEVSGALQSFSLAAWPVGRDGYPKNPTLPIGPSVVPFCGLCLESYKVIPKKELLGAYGQPPSSPSATTTLNPRP